MNEKNFLETIEGLLDLAVSSDGKITKADIENAFAEEGGLNNLQYENVCAYLTANGVLVEGFSGDYSKYIASNDENKSLNLVPYGSFQIPHRGIDRRFDIHFIVPYYLLNISTLRLDCLF